MAPPGSHATAALRDASTGHLQHVHTLVLREQPALGPRTAFSPPLPPPAPEDATTLARASLARIQAKIQKRLASEAPLDATTRAHYQETQGRITAALAANMQRQTD